MTCVSDVNGVCLKTWAIVCWRRAYRGSFCFAKFVYQILSAVLMPLRVPWSSQPSLWMSWGIVSCWCQLLCAASTFQAGRSNRVFDQCALARAVRSNVSALGFVFGHAEVKAAKPLYRTQWCPSYGFIGCLPFVMCLLGAIDGDCVLPGTAVMHVCECAQDRLL